METLDYRNNIRLKRSFPVLVKHESDLFIEGVTVNLSRKGAFIKLKNRLYFKAHAPAVLTFFLPPDFTGQNKTIVLQGNAVITRIDQENKGIAVEFVNALRGLERIDLPDLQEKIE